MLRLPLIICVLAELMRARSAAVPDLATANPIVDSLEERLERHYEKLERLTMAPEVVSVRPDRHYAKLDRLNSLAPEREEWGSDEDGWWDEELDLLTALEAQPGLRPEQIKELARDLQRFHPSHPSPSKVSAIADEYSDDGWQDMGEPEYAMDEVEAEGWGEAEDEPRSPAPPAPGRAPAAFSLSVSGTGSVSAAYQAADGTESPLSAAEQSDQLRADALAHLLRVRTEAVCRAPQPRWVSVRAQHPYADKVYLPYCVRLHRCAEDTGCCFSDNAVCAPLEMDRIELPLYVLTVDSTNTVAKLPFYNHTKCGCARRHELSLRDESSWTQRLRVEPTRAPAPAEPSSTTPTTPEPVLLRRCTCPNLFYPRPRLDGSCACDCDPLDLRYRRDCLHLKKGKEHFSLKVRYCITQGQCTEPECEFGKYDRIRGRCPPRSGRIRTTRRLRTQTHIIP